MSTRWVLLASLLCVTVPKVSHGQGYANRGAVVGGLSGALAGAGIGKHNGETAAGALIGGAVGLVTGSAIGTAMDNRTQQQMATQRYIHQQRVRQVQQRAVSPYDVIRMSQSGVSEEVMINQIRQYGVQGELQVQDVIALHRQGVPESVISAMQQAGSEPMVAEPVYVAPAPRPVVVEHHYVEPIPYYRPYPVYGHPYHHHHHYHRAPRGTSVSWGVTYRD